MKSKTIRKIETGYPARRLRGFLLLVILMLVAYMTLKPFFPTRVTPASVSAERFSGELAMAHLSVIASEPHPQGSPAQARVRDYLVQELARTGLEVEVQQAAGQENVVARLHGSDPSGAILIQAHYDSSLSSPGAADNGSGSAALLEIMRALAAGPTLRNDVIALFDDGEELPDEFTGTKVFIRKHPRMADVRAVIGMDTAARGYICTDDTGSENGWMVNALSQAYTGGAWYSLSGGGNYDTQPFREAGIQVLELEDNYPFYEQHTPGDVPAIVKPGTLQQLGEQALAVARELGDRDLSITKGPQEVYASLPLLGLIHYPESWSLILAILAGITLMAAFVLTMVRRIISWRGLGVALLTILLACALAGIGANALWKAAPGLFGWETQRWSDWPEVIPPNGWLLLILSNAVVVGFTTILYRVTRRWSERADFSMVGLLILLPLTIACALEIPQAAIVPVWPVWIGAGSWIAAALLQRGVREWALDLGSLLPAIVIIMFILPFIPGVFMGDGTKSVAIITGIWPLLLGFILPAVDGLLVQRGRKPVGPGTPE